MRNAALIAVACAALLGGVLFWSMRDTEPPSAAREPPVAPSSARMNAVLSQAVPAGRGPLTVTGRVLRDGVPVPDAIVTATDTETVERLGELVCGCEDHCGKHALDCTCQQSSDLLQQAVDSRRGEAVPVARATTTADGTFTLAGLAPGPVDLWADAPTLGAARLAAVQAGSTEVMLMFAEQISFKGRVLREKRESVAGAWVAALAPGHARWFDVTADADGRFVIGPVPKGDYVVVAGAPGGLTAHAQASDGVELVVPSPRALAGTVTLDGHPEASVTVHLEGEHRRRDTVSGPDGTFRFSALRPGDYVVTARRELLGALVKVDLQASDAPVTLALKRTVRLHGTATSETGRPREGVTVVMRTDDDEQSATTSSTGAYAFTVFAAKDVLVRARKHGLVGAEREALLDAPDVTVDLVLVDEALVTGTVFGPDGAPLLGANVTLSGAGERRATAALTDASGAFTLHGLKPGEWRVRAAHNDGASVEAQVRAPVSGVRLQLTAGLTLTGQVVTHEGKGVVAAVWVEGDDFSKQHETVSSADGRFTLRGLDEGTATVQVQTTEGPPQKATQVVELDASRRNDVRIELHQVLSISGTLVAADGAPVAGAWVFANRRDADVLSASGETNVMGEFEIAELAPGPCELSASHDGAYVSALAEAGATAVRLQLPALATVHGRVVTRAGEPITRFMVERQAIENPRGEFEVHVQKTRDLSISAEGYLPVWSKVVIKGTERVELGDVVLGQGGDLAVHVVGRDGKPIAGARIWSRSRRSQANAVTGRDGIATLHGLAQATTLTITASEHVSTVVDVPDGAHDFTVTLLRGTRITVRLRTATGRPAAGLVAASCITGCGSESHVEQSGDHGEVVLDGLSAGRWQVMGVTRGKREPLKKAELIDLEEGVDRVVEIVLPAAGVTLDVTAALPAGQWSEGLAVLMLATLPEPHTADELGEQLGAALAEARMELDRPGHFAFDSVAPGSYRLVVQLSRAGGEPVHWAVPLEVGESPRQVVRLRSP